MIIQAIVNPNTPRTEEENLATSILLSSLDQKMTLEGKLIMATEQSLQVSSTLAHPKQMMVSSTNLSNEQSSCTAETMFRHLNLNIPTELTNTRLVRTNPDGSCLLQCVVTKIHQTSTRSLVEATARKFQAYVIDHFDQCMFSCIQYDGLRGAHLVILLSVIFNPP